MPAQAEVSSDRRMARLQAAFSEEEYRGLRLAARVRLVAIAIIAVWIHVENPFPEILFYYGVLIAFALLGVAPLLLRRAGWDARWQRYLFPFLDVALFTLAVLVPNPFEQELLPPAMLLRYGNELYLFLFICASIFTYSPRVVLWTGCAAAAVWTVGTLWILSLPGSMGLIPDNVWVTLSDAEKVRAVVDPHRVYLGPWGRLVVILILTSAALAAFVWRARRLVSRQAEAERQRANLSRYFSANMVEELAQLDEPLGSTRQQDIAVLFADIVGFTAMSEALAPAAVIELLREFHGRMERAVFDHGGTLDKYIGDGIMATFGTPRAGTRDAISALRCAQSMVRSVEAWTGERTRRGEAPVRIGIGVHYGPVVMGNIGGEQHLEFAVVGDTVNLASRLERLTRELSVPLIVSDAAIEAARRETPDADPLFSGFVPGPVQAIRGRGAAMRIWQTRQ